MKTCSRCKTLYPDPRSSFYINKKATDGLASWCKTCANAATAKSRKRRAAVGRKDGKRPKRLKCRSCKKLRPFTHEFFMRDKHQQHGLYKRCRSCTNKERSNHRSANPLSSEKAAKKWQQDKRRINKRINKYPIKERARRMLRGIIVRSNTAGYAVDPTVTRDYLEGLLRESPRCPCCRITLDPSFQIGEGRQRDSPSIDRLDPSRGYSAENINVLCWRCNELKRDATGEELAMLAEWVSSLTMN